MKNDKKLDQSLKKLDEDIVWSKDRQQHIRNKLITGMRQEKNTRISWGKKVLPMFSVVFVIAIFTIIALSEFHTNDDIASHDNNQQTSGGKGNEEPHITPNGNDDQDIEENDPVIDEQNSSETNTNDTEKTNLDDRLTSEQNNNIEKEQADTPENNTQDRLLTQAEIMAAIKGQMTSDLSFKLPKEITLPEGKHLTAVTSSDASSYQVIYYQHDEPIPINNKLLFSDDNPAEVVARIHVKKYETQKEADDAVAYEKFDENMGESIKLSEGLTGYQDAGAGSVWISWNVGRWALTTQAHADDNERGVALAKEVIAYLDEYLLPAPRQNGYAHLDAAHEDNRIIWEKETTVYTIDQVSDPLKALEIAVNFE